MDEQHHDRDLRCRVPLRTVYTELPGPENACERSAHHVYRQAIHVAQTFVLLNIVKDFFITTMFLSSTPMCHCCQDNPGPGLVNEINFNALFCFTAHMQQHAYRISHYFLCPNRMLLSNLKRVFDCMS